MWFRRQNPDGRNDANMREQLLAQQKRQEESEYALSHGRLPAYVLERIAKQTQHELPWTSQLSVNEWNVLKRLQFCPLGQVMGSSYYHVLYRTGQSNFYGPFDMTQQEEALSDGRSRALRRLADEARALGANAVVGVKVAIRRTGEAHQLEFTAFGTAVKVDGLKTPRDPVLCTVSGQDLVKLLDAGTLPVGLATGVAVYYQYSSIMDMNQVRGFFNREVRVFTDAVYHTRRRAMNFVHSDLRNLDAHGFLAEETALEVEEFEVERGENDQRVDHIVQFVVVGTAVTQTTHPLPLNRVACLNLAE